MTTQTIHVRDWRTRATITCEVTQRDRLVDTGPNGEIDVPAGNVIATPDRPATVVFDIVPHVFSNMRIALGWAVSTILTNTDA